MGKGYHITENNVLRNQNRLRVYEVIISNPGYRFSELVRGLGMQGSTMDHHLYMLMKFDLVRRRIEPRHKCHYYPTKNGWE